jgi:hypothetical protein
MFYYLINNELVPLMQPIEWELGKPFPRIFQNSPLSVVLTGLPADFPSLYKKQITFYIKTTVSKCSHLITLL